MWGITSEAGQARMSSRKYDILALVNAKKKTQVSSLVALKNWQGAADCY